ncbi:MAG TPA: hypothetical protein VNG70_01290 [Candidatus Limnocylindria bacterium]|nr:hypothetical protein [Candidatus Limnocylindria bacterium]
MPELDRLEQLLADLGGDLEWPATPNLAPAIRRRILARPWFESRWAIAAAVAILALAALLVYPPTREAIAHWFNLRTRITQVTVLPTPTPLPPGPIGQRLGLGDSSTLPAARATVHWQVLLPSSLGNPDEVYVGLPPVGPAGGDVTLVYAARPGIPASSPTGAAVLVTEVQGNLTSDSFGKTLGDGATIDQVTVAGHPGYWIAGTPHVFYFIDAAGKVRYETLRLATNTILIDEGGTIVRIEGDLTKSQALSIAASLS